MKAFNFDGKTVLVTGASGGIGEAFARELSRRGATLVLVARSEEKLVGLASELGRAHVVRADLSAPHGAESVFDAVTAKGLEVDVLVNNAGFGVSGSFGELALDVQRAEIDLNVTALVTLTHLFLPMIERRSGGVIQVASMAAFMPCPYMTVYGATKAFVLSFGEALHAEYRDRGVRVLTLSPGATETAFFVRSGEVAGGAKKARPEDVVRTGLAAFLVGRSSVIHGSGNNAMALLARAVSRQSIARLIQRLTKSALSLPHRSASSA